MIREMKETDWTCVRKIYEQALLEGRSTFQTECPGYDVWDKGHLSDCRFVILLDGKVAGWCAISPTSSRKVYFSVNEASIRLHKKLGFRETGYREKIAKDRFGKWQDTVLLERRSKKIL